MEQTEAPSTINPGDEPPEEYFLFLKRGGEVAQLGQRFTAEDLRTAADQLANLSFADLVQQIDETQQASSQVRDELDDMPTGPDQIQAAQELLAECRRVANDNFIALSSSKPSELRAEAFNLHVPAAKIYDAASFPDKVHRLARLIYASENFDKYKYHKPSKPRSTPTHTPHIRTYLHLSYLLYIQSVRNFVRIRIVGKLGHCTHCCT